VLIIALITSNSVTAQTTAELRQEYCLSTIDEVNSLMNSAVAASEAIVDENRSPKELENVNRLRVRVDDKYDEYINRCQSNSATMGATKIAYKEFKFAVEALNNKVGNIK
jgi:hypothetical protein